MNWKNVITGGALIGAFALGAMFAPIDRPLANQNDQNAGKNWGIVQTANGDETAEQGKDYFTCSMNGRQMGPGAGMGKHFSGTNHKVISNALGMTEDELQSARNEGKSIADLAKEKGVKIDVVMDAMMMSRKAELEKLVTEGQITQEKMDAMMKNMETMMKQAVERNSTGPMHHRGGGMGMGMGHGARWSGNADNPTY